MIVPTFDIDLIWHTHMRYPLNYQEFSQALCRFILDHDDSIESSVLTDAYQRTADRWRQSYRSEYGQNVDRKHLETSQYTSACAMVFVPTTIPKSSHSTVHGGCGSSCGYALTTCGGDGDGGGSGDGGCGGGCSGD